MLDPFAAVKGYFKVNHDKASIDDIIFKMHYRATFILLVVSSILVTQRQYIGEHIKCIVDLGIPENVINTFCFFSSTYTVPKHFNESSIANGEIPHPGVGPAIESDEVVHHTYYQWVPFILFFQAISFYIPHYIWKSKEGGKLSSLISGLRLVFMPYYDTDFKDDQVYIPSKDNVKKKIEALRKEFIDNMDKYSSWPTWLIFCEVFNLVNLMLQIYFTDVFLGGAFWEIGSQVWNNEDWDAYLDPLDIVFPKVTKCAFHKYGPSGTIQRHDALCVMSLNVIHEKIYTILWFWYAILFIFTIAGLLFRLITYIMHSRSSKFNEYIFEYACPGKLDMTNMMDITRNRYYGDWLFLYFLAKNMNSYTFKNLFESLGEDMNHYRNPRQNHDSLIEERVDTLLPPKNKMGLDFEMDEI